MADEPLKNPLEEEEELVTPQEELEPEELEEIEESQDEVEGEPTEEEEPEDEEPKISRREQLRIQDLLNRKPEGTPKPKGRTDRLDYRQEFQVEDDDAKRLEQDREQEAEFYFNQGLEQAKALKFHTRLEVDAPVVANRFPILDKSNEEAFHPAVANSLNQFYLSMVGYDKETDTVQNPDLRYADFTDAVFELADEIAKNMVAGDIQAVKKQAAQAGLRPGAQASKKLDLGKAPQDMSDEELDAFLKANNLG